MNELDEKGKSEVERIMNLALDWLDTWDVLGEGKDKEPEKSRVAAMHKLKDAVTALALKAQNQ